MEWAELLASLKKRGVPLRRFEGQVNEFDNKKEQHMPSTKIKIDMALVFGAGVMWSTVGIGVRLIETANVWQILLYRSFSLSLFLFLIIFCLKKIQPF